MSHRDWRQQLRTVAVVVAPGHTTPSAYQQRAPRIASPDTLHGIPPRFPRRANCTGRRCSQCRRGIAGTGWLFPGDWAVCLEHAHYSASGAA